MKKRIYISADYANEDGDRNVVEQLNSWANDNCHIIDFVDMAQVVSGSVSYNNPDCRPCDLKKEFNNQINKSSIAVFVVGNRTALRTAGSSCGKAHNSIWCTPYKNNANGSKFCDRSYGYNYLFGYSNDVNPVNSYSYLRHEFEQAKAKNKEIVILFNSTRYEYSWLPSYMKGFESRSFPFWNMGWNNNWVPNYQMIKRELGYV